MPEIILVKTTIHRHEKLFINVLFLCSIFCVCRGLFKPVASSRRKFNIISFLERISHQQQVNSCTGLNRWQKNACRMFGVSRLWNTHVSTKFNSDNILNYSPKRVFLLKRTNLEILDCTGGFVQNNENTQVFYSASQ